MTLENLIYLHILDYICMPTCDHIPQLFLLVRCLAPTHLKILRNSTALFAGAKLKFSKIPISSENT